MQTFTNAHIFKSVMMLQGGILHSTETWNHQGTFYREGAIKPNLSSRYFSDAVTKHTAHKQDILGRKRIYSGYTWRS